jgi:hypothetical protein
MLGRFDEALRLNHRAVELDPLNASSWELLGETEYFMGQRDKAAADVKKGIELSPDAWPGPVLLSQIYVMQGRPNDALTEIELERMGQSVGFRCWPITPRRRVAILSTPRRAAPWRICTRKSQNRPVMPTRSPLLRQAI